MKLSEASLRRLIRQVLVEDAGGPAALKQSSTAIIQAINDDNPGAFWGAFLTNLEGLAGTVQHAPNVDKLEISKFIDSIRPAAKLCNQLRNAHQQQAKEKGKQPQQGNNAHHEGVVREVIEPFEMDIVNHLRSVNQELNRLGFQDEKYESAFGEIQAAFQANKNLIAKLRQLG